MRLVTIIVIVIALGLSGLSAFLLLSFVKEQGPEKIVEHELVPAERILVAKKALRVGIILKADEHFEWRAWPRDGIAPHYVIESSGMAPQFVGSAVMREMVLGEPIVGSKVFKPGERSLMSAVLAPGMRAATAPVNVQAGVGGFVSPGDRVDLILISGVKTALAERGSRGTVENRNELKQFGEVILSDLRVLAIDQSLQSLGTGTQVARTITFEVNAKQAEILAVARTIGEIYLVLRSNTRSASPTEEREFPFTSELEILKSNITSLKKRYVTAIQRNSDTRKSTRKVASASQKRPPSGGTRFETVTILRGAESEVVRFRVGKNK